MVDTGQPFVCPYHWRVGETCAKPFYPLRLAVRVFYAVAGASIAITFPIWQELTQKAPTSGISKISYLLLAGTAVAYLTGIVLAVVEEPRNEWRCFLSAFAWPAFAVTLLMGLAALSPGGLPR
jgi:hypothetical protein